MLLDDANIKIDATRTDGAAHVSSTARTSPGRSAPPRSVRLRVSGIRPLGCVRDFLLDLQRDLARQHNMHHGRPGHRHRGAAQCSPEDLSDRFAQKSRAQRRYEEHLAKGQKATYEEVLERSESGTMTTPQRKIAPLRQADDADAGGHHRADAFEECH